MIRNENVRKIDDYKIMLNELVGKGAYGQVFGCQSLKDPLLRLCAKVMMISDNLKNYADREQQISEIVSQYQSNQNIVKIYQAKFIQELEKKLIIIMEKCDINLKEYIEQQHPQTFSDNELFDFLDQFLTGYSVLFERDIIHRDIKPENILIKKEKEKIIYKLTDFGIAKIYKAHDFHFTKIGTPAYAAPEINSQLNDQEVVNNFIHLKKFQHSKSQVDVYSLGIILYQMAYGKLPFDKQQTSIIEFLQKIKSNPLRLAGTSNYKEIIEKMLVYYPEQRMSFEYLYEFVNEKKKTKITNPGLFKLDNKNFKIKEVERNQPVFKRQQRFDGFSNMGEKNQPIYQKFPDHIKNNQFPFQYKPNEIKNNQPAFLQKPNEMYRNQSPNLIKQNEIKNNQPAFFQKPNEMQRNQSPFLQKPDQLLRITVISPHQKIKEYMQFILNDQGDLIKEEIKLRFSFYVKNQTFSFDQLKDLVRIYKRQIQNPDQCQSQTQFFFYCILCLLDGSQVQNYQFQDKKILDDIKRLYKSLVESKTLDQ
ncbi:unnamed protein product [Paramecium octaurelia]|uniref:Protein kinase domain-containing protein n=1 Tax=Paramecium octaurelia TaxID=43137 RepID=A0A8S1T326_PAROT|nr:unnamed protein product [Paramecium octaurelia]